MYPKYLIFQLKRIKEVVLLRNNKIAVLIPCYNEAQTINKVICDWKTALNVAYQEVQIYVYDNNSTDKTAEIAKKAGAIVVKEKRQDDQIPNFFFNR